MTKKLPLSRPATSAIAAFLALSAPAAFAQAAPAQPAPAPASPTIEMSPPVIVPPVAPTTTPTVPAPTVTAPAPETPPPATPVLRVPLDIEPAPETAPAPKAAEAPAPKPAQAGRSAPAQREKGPEPASATTTTRSVDEPAPVNGPAAAAIAEAAPPPAAVPTVPATGFAAPPSADVANDSFPWELAGGAAALLLAGGAAFALTRRRRVVAEAEPATAYEAPVTPQPAVHRETPVRASLPRSTPAFTAAPHGSMGRHEAMAMAGPSDDNPFLTLKKRLKRARFQDRRERMEYEALLAGQKDGTRKPASAWDVAQRPAPAPAEQKVLRPEPARGHRGLRPGFAKG
ncbi:hypothetical protein KNJ79_06230 [Sphingopyxis indica]|uniref:hypothetical protein n=1 Tax=Sphingopyxis indica TaxID=436663 RepID=UPI002938D612|nr:hypothetical protein [Sphingopyxis indica]WOF44518.1 hypothetical protein KNJ79_06230 [Sphingopyxis indica]